MAKSDSEMHQLVHTLLMIFIPGTVTQGCQYVRDALKQTRAERPWKINMMCHAKINALRETKVCQTSA